MSLPVFDLESEMRVSCQMGAAQLAFLAATALAVGGCARVPPTAEERDAEFRRAIQDGLAGCKVDYPTPQELRLEQGWTYEECARARAAIHMSVWETYR